MKYILSILAGLAIFGLTACSQSAKHSTEQSDNDTAAKKALVVYFSATGTTKGVANDIAKLAGADIIEIVPERAYTDADLDWRDKNSRSSVEMADSASRPAIKAPTIDAADYDIVFIGYPIWWDMAPTVVNTYIESAGLDGKTVIPFATSGGSGINNSVTKLKKTYPDINWTEGKLLNEGSESELSDWVESVIK